MNTLTKIKKDTSGPIDKWVYYVLRIIALLLVVILFVPGLNPARISEKVNRNLALFTSGLFYNSLVADMGRIFSKGWLPESTMLLDYFSSLIACLGIAATGCAACMSIGNNKFKRLGNIIGIGGGIVTVIGMIGIKIACNQIFTVTEVAKVKPFNPSGLILILVLSIIFSLCSLTCLILVKAPEKDEKYHMDSPMQLFLMLMPFLLLVFVFSYLPLWGWRYAFFDYKVGTTLSKEKFVGFYWFTFLFQNEATRRDIVRVLKNTLGMSGLGILTSWCAMAFAIFLSEIRNMRARRIIQTLTTVPNFISWVLVYAVAFCVFSTDGFVSSVFVNSGIWEKGKNMLMGDDHIWLKMLGWGMWKGLGWGAIMYLAAISGIDQQLYEAATVDGAGRFQKMWHITVPELIPTYMVLLLLSIAGILNNGMEQYYCFKNATNANPIEVLDLYVYTLGIGKGVIPLSTVVGMVKSIVSVALLFCANSISKAVRGTSIV